MSSVCVSYEITIAAASLLCLKRSKMEARFTPIRRNCRVLKRSARGARGYDHKPARRVSVVSCDVCTGGGGLPRTTNLLPGEREGCHSGGWLTSSTFRQAFRRKEVQFPSNSPKTNRGHYRFLEKGAQYKHVWLGFWPCVRLRFATTADRDLAGVALRAGVVAIRA
jgi:hypothetical protein